MIGEKVKNPEIDGFSGPMLSSEAHQASVGDREKLKKYKRGISWHT